MGNGGSFQNQNQKIKPCIVEVTDESSKGIWFGKGPLGDVIYSQTLLYHLIIDIDGVLYSYEGGTGQLQGKTYVKDVTKKKMNLPQFEWFYEGESVKSKKQIKNFVDDINAYLMDKDVYNILFHNCQTMGAILKNYAQGVASYDLSYQLATRQNILPM